MSSLWRNRGFVRLWSAETVSQLGTQITLLALPLTAIVALHASPLEVGALTAVEHAPFLLVGLPAGVWVDRLPRRVLMVWGDIGRAVALATIPVAHWLGVLHVAQLYVVAFAVGVCTVFFDVAYQSFLPSLVGREHIVEGNAKLEGSRSAAQLAGPGLAGLLVGAVSAPPAIALDALSFVASALFLVGIAAHASEEQLAPRRRMRTEVAEGIRHVLGHPLLRPIAACTSVSNLFGSMGVAVLVLYEVRELGLSAGTVGLVMTIGNAGVLLGALVATRVARRLGLGRAIVASAATFGVSFVLVALAPRAAPLPALVAGQFLYAWGGVVYNINQVSLRQTITPEHLLGRMNATMRFLVWGTMPIGGLAGGALGEAIGLHATLWVVAAGSALAAIPVAASAVRRLVTMPEPPEPAPDAASTPAPALA